MARTPWQGTPATLRSSSLLHPKQVTYVRSAILLAVLIFAVTVGIYSTGTRRVLSPGPVATHHAGFEQTCAACHDDNDDARANLRCERCHDTTGAGRLTQGAHVWLGSRDVTLAATTPDQTCTKCHNEHLGRGQVLKAVQDGECASCHTNVRDIASHPEFAVVKASKTFGVGMLFGHERHLAEVRKAGTARATCEACHEQTADKRAFQPIVFERHCASCHAKDLLDPGFGVAPAWLVTPDQIRAAGYQTSMSVAEGAQGKVKAEGAKHRDPWMLINALRIRAALDPEGAQLERSGVEARLAYLDGMSQMRPLALVADADLEAAIASVRGEIAGLDERLANNNTTASSDLSTLLTKLGALATELQAAAPESISELQALASLSAAGAPAPAPADDPDRDARYQRRKDELSQLVAAITERATRSGDSALVARAADLGKRVEALSVLPDDGSAMDGAAARLVVIDNLLVALQSVPGPAQNDDLAAVAAASLAARQRLTGGLSPADFETARGGLLRLLDAISARGGSEVAARTTDLRRQLISLQLNVIDPAELGRRRADRARQLNRLVIEQQVRLQPWSRTLPALQLAATPIVSAEPRQPLADAAAMLDYAQRSAPTTASADELRLTLGKLMGRPPGVEAKDGKLCLKCHELDASGARLAAVRIAEPVHLRARFSHAPHVTRTACATCHQMAEKSTLSSDANVPGVATCQSCHKPAEARSACATCHNYHPAAAARLFR